MRYGVRSHDELVRHRLEVVTQGGGYADGIIRGREVQLGRERVHEDASPDTDGIARFAEHPLEALAREEPKVRPVEQSQLRAPELTAQQGEADAAMGDVGNGGDHVALRLEHAGGLHQHLLRLDEVFQNIAEHHHVEPLSGEGIGEVERLDVAHDHAVGEARRNLCSNGVLFDPRDATAALTKHARHVAGRRPHLQDSPVAARQEDHLREGRVAVRQVDAVVVVPKGIPRHRMQRYPLPRRRTRRADPMEARTKTRLGGYLVSRMAARFFGGLATAMTSRATAPGARCPYPSVRIQGCPAVAARS